MQALGYFVAYELVKYTFCTRTYKYHCFYLQKMQIAWHSLAHSGLATLVARGAIRSEGTRTNEFLLSILPSKVVCIKYAYSLSGMIILGPFHFLIRVTLLEHQGQEMFLSQHILL